MSAMLSSFWRSTQAQPADQEGADALRLGELLIQQGALTPEVLESALREQRSNPGRLLGQVLLEAGHVSPAQLQAALAERMRHIELPPLPETVRSFAHLEAMTLYVLAGRIGQPAVQSWLDDVRRKLGFPLNVEECTVAEIESVRGNQTSNDAADLSAIRRVRHIIAEAVGRHASDIHMTLREADGRGGLKVQYRINGSLEPAGGEHTEAEGVQMLRAMFQGMAAVADATVRDTEDQHAIIIDPAFLKGPTGQALGLSGIRLARAPLYSGMNLAARLLYTQSSDAFGDERLGRLGYSRRQLRVLQMLARRTEGINPITGPTGSGKSTTLAQEIMTILEVRDGVRIITIEDPVEYEFRHPNVWQYRIANANTDEEKSAAFAGKLKTALRQDPDIIMVGEIRGLETAKEAINAALTGHQVWTTLHVSDPFMIPQRLIAMGIDGFFLTDPKLLSSLIAQRLTKTLCPHCSVPWDGGPVAHLPEEDTRNLRAWLPLAPFASGVRLRGVGCAHCRGGFKGRTVVAQVIPTDVDLLLSMIEHGPMRSRTDYMKRADFETDMMTHGVLKVLDGRVDPRSLVEVLGPIEPPAPTLRQLTAEDV